MVVQLQACFLLTLQWGKAGSGHQYAGATGGGQMKKNPNGLVYVLPFLNGFCREAGIYYEMILLFHHIPSIPQKVSRVRSLYNLPGI